MGVAPCWTAGSNAIQKEIQLHSHKYKYRAAKTILKQKLPFIYETVHSTLLLREGVQQFKECIELRQKKPFQGVLTSFLGFHIHQYL